jgi:two-component system CheB/CheR fusion protein
MDREQASTPAGDDALARRLLNSWLDGSVDYAVLMFDPHGRVVGAKGAVRDVLGYAPQELAGRPLTRIFTPEDLSRALHEHELQTAGASGIAFDDRWHVRKDGTHIWAVGSMMAVKDDSGATLGFVKVLRDRTDLRGQIQTLENRVEALTQREQERDVFLGTVGHELRNPLAPLTNAMHLIRMLDKDNRMRQPLQIIERQLAQLTRLVDDLMDMTRADAGKLELRLEDVDLQRVITPAVEAASVAAHEKGLKIETLLPPAPIVIQADRARIEQILVNLLNNAVKYTERGKIWVKVTVEGNEAVIRVADTGMGIASDVLPRIFELFTQEARVSEAASGGLGIGLALVKNMVHAHHGVVEVRSDGRDKGSEFTVRLPLTQPP